MRRYIEEWIKRELKQVVDEMKHTIAMIAVSVDDNNKKVSTRK
jgi:hypothetical protein